jgi:hypothetical protein
MSFVRGRRFSSRVPISAELSDAPCAVCGEASGVHDWWVYRPDVGQKKSVLQQAREGLLDLSASTIVKDPAALLRALRDDTSGSSTGGGGGVAGGGTAAEKLKSKKEKLKDDDNFLLAQGDDDDENNNDDDGNGGAADVEGASPALSTRGSPAACDGHVTECNECFCAKSIADLLWTDKMDARVLTPPKQINAIMLEKLTTSWAMYMHLSALQVEHVSLADCPGGSFLDIVTHNAEAAAKRKMQKSVAKKNEKEMAKKKKKKKKNGRSSSSSLSSSGSSGSEEDLYAGLSDSDSAADLDTDSGSSEDDDDFSMPHIASLQILGFSEASAPAVAASLRRASTSISSAAQSMLSVLASATTRTTGSSASDQTTGIALLFPRLKRLVLRECDTLKTPALVNVNDCLLLKYLDLSGCEQISSLAALTDLKTLSHLNISSMTELIVPAAVLHLTTKMPLLRELVAAGLPELDDDCFVMIMQKLANLATLDVSGSSITENALTRAAGTPGTRTLQVLIARETQALVAAESAGAADAAAAAAASDDAQPSTLAGELEGLLNFTALETLDLQRNSRITAAMTLNVAVCPNIKSLALASTPLTAADMDALSTAKHLVDLSLCWCDVDDECLEALAEIALLEKLALDGCMRITPDGLEHLEGLRSLQSLSLYCCTKIEDAAALILRSFPLLHTLNVGRCSGITEAFVAELLAPPRPATAAAAAAEDASAAEAAKADAGATGNDVNNNNNNNNSGNAGNAGNGGLQLLRHLNLEGAAITDASVRLVTSSLRFIEVLHMERCDALTAAEPVVELIKTRSETLRFLFLSECEQLAKGKLQISMAAAKVPSMCVRF